MLLVAVVSCIAAGFINRQRHFLLKLMLCKIAVHTMLLFSNRCILYLKQMLLSLAAMLPRTLAGLHLAQQTTRC